MLTKFTTGIDRKMMLKALGCMIGNRKKLISSWQFSVAKEAASEAQRGRPSPMKGKKASPEAIKKMSDSLRGRPSPKKGSVTSPEIRLKQRMAKLGRRLSDETKKKIGIKSLGNKHRLGKFPTDETRLKLSAALMGNSRTLGLVHSKETKQKMTASHHSILHAMPNNKLGLRGVVRHQGRYRSRMKVGSKYHELGSYDCPAAAHFAYVVATTRIAMNAR